MQRQKYASAVLFLSLVFSVPALAQEEPVPDDETGPPSMRGMSPEQRRAAFEALSEDDKEIVRKRRREARAQQRAEWEAMTPEEREVRRAEVQKKAAELTPEQRAAVREMQEQRQNAKANRGKQAPAAAPQEPATETVTGDESQPDPEP